MWHYDVTLDDGTPYPLRNRLDWPSGPVNDLMLGLTAKQSRTGCAVHELGHAVVWLAGGLHVRRMSLDAAPNGRPGGRAECAAVTNSLQERMARIVGVVAGERAQDRWLRETGLWTSNLAAMAELNAAHDRAYVFAADPHPRPGFGDGEVDYSVLHDLADEALDAQWDRILAALPVLVREGRMTGDRLAACTGLSNPARGARIGEAA